MTFDRCEVLFPSSATWNTTVSGNEHSNYYRNIRCRNQLNLFAMAYFILWSIKSWRMFSKASIWSSKIPADFGKSTLLSMYSIVGTCSSDLHDENNETFRDSIGLTAQLVSRSAQAFRSLVMCSITYVNPLRSISHRISLDAVCLEILELFPYRS